MIEKAFVSGQIAQSIFQDDGKLFILRETEMESVSECTPYEKNLFFVSDAEIKVFENISIEELRGKLLEEKNCFDALYGAIGGMDNALSQETRILSIQRAESLLEKPEILGFVRARFLGNPVPDEADLPGAVELCVENDFSNMKRIYGYLLQGKELIERIQRLFGETISELRMESDYVKLKNFFISAGLFAQLFLNIIEERVSDVLSLILKYKPGFNSPDPPSGATKVLSKMIERLEKIYSLFLHKSDTTRKLIEPVTVYRVGKPYAINIGARGAQVVSDKKTPYNKKKPS